MTSTSSRPASSSPGAAVETRAAISGSKWLPVRRRMSSRAAAHAAGAIGDLDDVDDVRDARRHAQRLAADRARARARPSARRPDRGRPGPRRAGRAGARAPSRPRTPTRRRCGPRRRPADEKPLGRALGGELRRRGRDVRGRAARPLERVAARELLDEPEERAVVAAEEHRGLVRVARAAHRAQQRDVVRRRALLARQPELLAEPRGDDGVAQRLLQRLVVADVRRERHRRQHLGEADRRRRGDARLHVGDDSSRRGPRVGRERDTPGRDRSMRASLLPLLRCPRCRADRSLTLTARAERRARGARGRARVRALRRDVRGRRRDRAPPARPAGLRRARGRRPRALRRGHAQRRLGPRADPRAAVGRARLLAGAGHGDEEVLAAVPFEPGAAPARRRLEHVLGEQHLRARGPRGHRAGHRDDAAAGARRPPTGSSRPARSTSSACSRSCTTRRSRARASTTSSAARSCTTTTRRTCGARCASAIASCAPAAGSSSSTSRCASCCTRSSTTAEEVAEFEGNEHVYFAHSYLLAARAAGFRVAAPWMRGVAARPVASRAAPARRVPAHRALGLAPRHLRRPLAVPGLPQARLSAPRA